MVTRRYFFGMTLGALLAPVAARATVKYILCDDRRVIRAGEWVGPPMNGCWAARNGQWVRVVPPHARRELDELIAEYHRQWEVDAQAQKILRLQAEAIWRLGA